MKWYSQAGQDKWVHEFIGDSGFFVDVGAYDGVLTSNTYALEEAGWYGVCIEPQPEVFGRLHTLRSATNGGHSACVQAVVSNVSGVAFMNGDRVVHDGSTQVRCDTLTNILDKLNAPPVIDYLSIDVEGHEMQVLFGMDFEVRHVKLITIEHNAYRDGPQLKDNIYDFLSRAGFRRAISNVGCVEPCPPPAYVDAPFEDWYVNDRM